MQTAVAVYDLDREKIDLIKRTVAKGATDLELELFLHACKRTGLDPLMKQIYAIKRWSHADNRDVMSFQTGIDGLRLIADRTGQYAGSDEPTFLLGDDGFPDVASVTVYKLVGSLKCAFTHSVRWKEYVQLKKDGTPTAFWVRMPFGQLGKCAESGALRKAFPLELSGLYTDDEMMQADSEPKSVDTRTAFAEKFPQQAQAIAAKLAASPAPEQGAQAALPEHVPLEGSQGPSEVPHGAAVSIDDPAAAYRTTIQHANTPQEATRAYNAAPEELRQDLFKCYQEALKAFGKGKQ